MNLFTDLNFMGAITQLSDILFLCWVTHWRQDLTFCLYRTALSLVQNLTTTGSSSANCDSCVIHRTLAQ